MPIEITSPDGAKTRYEYDSAFNPIKVTDPLGHVFTYNYDALGNLISTSDPLTNGATMGYDPQSNKIAWIRDSLGQTTSFSYNSQGNLLSIAYPDSTIEKSTYDKNNLASNSLTADSKATYYTYSSTGELTKLKNPLGYETEFTYTPGGDISSITDALGHTTSYQHDISGNLIKTTFTDGTFKEYKYDAAGRLVNFKDRAGQSQAFSYDSNGFLQSEVYSSGKKLQLNYDKLGTLSSVTQSGSTNRLEAVYEYDLSNRLTLAKFPGLTSSKSYDVSYEYDAAGNRRLMSYPDGYALKYEYDTSNRLARISDTSNALIASYIYDAAGRLTGKTLGNSISTTYSYNNLNKLTKLSNYDVNGKILSQSDYTYNSAGLLTSVKTPDGLTSYTYDDVNQLIKVKYPNSEVKYNFDAVGNRISVETDLSIIPYTTNILNQYTDVGKTHFEYDLNGNLASQTLNGNKISYEWNENNQLTKVKGNGILINYDYDYLGRLFSKVTNGIERRYVWDGENLIAEMDSSNKLLTRYIYDLNIKEIVKVNSNGINSWPQQDALGSITGYSRDDGTLAGKLSYDVYGKIQSGDLIQAPKSYEGMQWDSDANLYYSRSRWYDATTGSFISKSSLPVSNVPEYTYAGNSPTNFVDPSNFEIGKPTQALDAFNSISTYYLEPEVEFWAWRINKDLRVFDSSLWKNMGISKWMAFRFNAYNTVFKVAAYYGIGETAYRWGQTLGAFQNRQASFGDLAHDTALLIGDFASFFPQFRWVSPLFRSS